MNKILRVVSAGSLALLLAACSGGSSSSGGAKTGKGTAKGFGGDVTVTITVEGGKITKCDIEGKDETETVGQAAFAELSDQVIKANGAEIDGVSGATFTSDAVKAATADAMKEAGL